MWLPKITVVIPTRERSDVLGAALRTVTVQAYDNLEILVSDNCSTDQTQEVVRANTDPRIRYVNTGKRLGMSQNWEFALSHVSEGWVMMIGDDDGLLPGALNRIAELIHDTSVTAVNSSFTTFIWPNQANAGAGRLLVPMRQGIEIRNSKEWLRRAVQGRAWYSDLPMLYNGGAVNFSLIDEIRRRKGTFFQSCQPDIFSAISLASVTDHYAFSHEPFAVAGHSRHSNGASWSAASGKSSVSADILKAKQMFLSEANIPWHADVPVLDDGNIPFSIDLLVYESYLQTVYIHGNPLKITPQDQLALFLARDIGDRERMAEWVKRFVARHCLDLVGAQRRVPALRRRMMWDKVMENAAAFRDLYRIEPSFGLRIRDVYEASIVAATVLRTRPSRIKSYVNTLNKWSSRGLRQACRAAVGMPTKAP